MNAFKSWDEMTILEQYACQYSDMHKDAFGFRPHGINISDWTEEKFIEEFKFLGQAIDRSIAEEKAAEARAIVAFEQRVQALMCQGASRNDIINQLMASEGLDGDIEYFCFCNGLPFNYFNV